MRKYFLSFYAILSFVLLAGCSAFQVEFRDEQGRALDRPYGPEKVITTTPFIQNYDGWVAISVDGSPAITAPYGKPFPVNMVSQKRFFYEIFWDEQVGYDGVLKKVRHSRTGLYNGKPIIIDEFLLRNWAKLEIIWYNTSPMPMMIWDNQKNAFLLKPFEEKTLFVVAGKYTLNWRANEGFNRITKTHVRTLAPGHKVPWANRSVDTIFEIQQDY